MNTQWRELLRAVGVADMIDVLLVAAFFYAVIGWLRQSSSGSASRRVAVIGFFFLAVYLLANTFDLYLVESLLRVLAVVLLLAVVVVFQSDLRRLLDRIGEWGFSRRAASPSSSRTVSLLTEAAAKLAEERTGALIALRGAEPWTSHVQGGVELGGVVSRPLLYSIFQPDTPGHDGAVLMEGDRVAIFGAHLPLATRLPEASRFGGTRHAAALGLAQECDALVIVVSEERGTISVAEDGTLTEMGSAGELGERLERFWRRYYGGASAIRKGWWGRRSLSTALMSLSLAALAWLLFAYSPDTVYRTFEVPIAFHNVPPEWTLENRGALKAEVALSGPEPAFRLLDPEELVISFDLSNPKPGVNELTIDEDNLDLPANLSLYGVEPREVRVTARRQEPLELPVQIRTSTPVPDSLVLVPDPGTVTVWVPEGGTDRPRQLLTEPIDPAKFADSAAVTGRLVIPPGARLRPDQQAEVTVRLERRPGPRP